MILTRTQRERLLKDVAFEIWEPLSDDRLVCRFVTSWATTDAELHALDEALDRL